MCLVENQETLQSSEGEAKVITLCGSTKFEAEFAEVDQRLTSVSQPDGRSPTRSRSASRFGI